MDIKDMKCNYISLGIYKNLGYTPDEVIGTSFFDAVPKESAEKLQQLIRAEIEEAQTKNQPLSILYETQMYHKLGFLI
jgi:PAS domain S-box-containing protein